MPNWKKLVTSGSNAQLNSISVTNAVTASTFLGGTFLGNLLGTASFVDTASYALNLANAYGYDFSQSVATSSWVITHGLDTVTPLVQIYNESYSVILPKEITSSGSNATIISFDYNQAGYAIVSRGDGITNVNNGTSSYAFFATTASYIDGGFF
jgi:hypothetical protein